MLKVPLRIEGIPIGILIFQVCDRGRLAALVIVSPCRRPRGT